MKLSEVKRTLANAHAVNFRLPDGSFVPENFHVTEVGIVTRHFIDCGGVTRKEEFANFQLWDANDYDHRLKPQKLLDIISLSEKMLNMQDYDVEAEYQGSTIGRYDIGHNGQDFLLLPKQTACLAPEKCNIPEPKINNSTEEKVTTCCGPDGNCC